MSRRVARGFIGMLVVVVFPCASPRAAEPEYENLALGKPASADASQSQELSPDKGNDGDINTRWCPPDNDSGHWWQVDLGAPKTLTGARVTWEFDGAIYGYKIEGSADGKTWSMLSDQTKSKDRTQEQRLNFKADGIRHVRLTGTAIEEGHWGSFLELEVFGTKPASRAQVAARPSEDRSAKLLKGIKVPTGWELSLFAAPPDVHYPTCLAAAPTGEVFVGVDENGSLDAKPGRGRVVRCVDKDGDGTADEFKVFAEMDSPRGLVWDGSTRTLYVQHPPTITAHQDADGDGIADREEVLVKGIGFDLKFQGADHTTNGMRLGIDGFLYVAVGDYGFVKAVGKDGATVQLHGGGITRVRPDGTGLEVYSRGQRNIYDVALDPYLNAFTRDNTNDGGGWDVRLSHVIPTANMGYPSLFVNFNDEIVQPLADYGGGSPCGSLYLQEPGFPAGFGDTLYTCEWGRSIVYRHPLTPNGAGFKAGQEVFVEIPRPTDMDVDGRGRIFISSWKDGNFNFSGPNVGYVIRVTPPGEERPAFPDLKKDAADKLVARLDSPSTVMREAAQREILERQKKTQDAQRPALASVRQLQSLAISDKPLASRIAALFTIDQVRGKTPAPAGNELSDPKFANLREYVVRIMGDHASEAAKIPAKPLIDTLSDKNPRVRLQAVVSLARLGKTEAAPAIVKLTADSDPLVAHAAINALVTLKATDACLAALDPKTSTLIPGAARALQGIHDARTVDGLIEKLLGAKLDDVRKPILKALCRLYTREAKWEGKWWTTRPDTSGPYFNAETWDQTDKIGQALRSALGSGDDESARWLLTEMMRNKVELEGTSGLILNNAAIDPAFRAITVGVLANRPNLPPDALKLLGQVASSESESPGLRARALRGLLRAGDKLEARKLVISALAAVGHMEKPPGELQDAWQEFARDGRHARDLDFYAKLSEGPDGSEAELAYAVLLQADANAKTQARAKELARDAIARAWDDPKLSARLLHAVGRTRLQAYASEVKGRLDHANPSVRLAAQDASKRLGLDRTSAPSANVGPLIAKLPFEEVLAAVQKDKGDAAVGAQLFERLSCVNCHTVSKTETPKGPFLGDIANRYSRAELAEAILKPSAKIAQGFETQKFATADGQTIEGFVVRESGTEVELRNAAGMVVVLPKADIEERAKSELSVMPNGLADPITPKDLASILSYLELLKEKNSK